MPKKMLLVDFENKQNLDLSSLDASYSAIVFVGHHQPEPKIKKKIDSKNRFVCVDYQKIRETRCQKHGVRSCITSSNKWEQT
jgi:hypothetical protein